MKDSFVLYTKYLDNIQALSMEQRGMLFTSLMLYASGQEPEEMDPVTAMAFSFIKSQMDKDIEKYNETCAKRSEAGKLGGRPKKQEEAKKANGFSENQKKQGKAKKADNDNEYDNENENDIKNTYSCAFEALWAAYPRKKEKANAYKCYKARLADGFSEDELLTAVKRYADECLRNRTEQKYIKHGSTFLSESTPFLDYLGDDYKPDVPRLNVRDNNNFERRQYDMDKLELDLLEVN